MKASVLGVLFAATLLAPVTAHAYGRATPTPNLFAPRSDSAEPPPTALGLRPYRSARQAKRSHGSRQWSGLTHHWRSVRAASSQPLDGGPSAGRPAGDAEGAPRTFGGGEVVAEASRWIGSGKFTRQPGPWCADAVSTWLERSGHRPLDGRMASSALAYGPRLAAPEVGSLAVLGTRRGWAYHVGVVSSVDGDGSIHLISGNWGRRVAEAVVSRGSVIAFVAVR